MRVRLFCLLALCLASEAMAAKKDFKGLFGSYRREKFTENEGRSTDFGLDLMLSTLLPVTSLANSTTTRGDGGAAMSYATFFNAEVAFFFTLSYHWEIHFNIGYYSYDTRKENSPPGATPQFHLFEMEAFPLMAGVKYRFSTTDIVPYVGLGAGMVYARRKGYYDYIDTAYDESFSTGLAAQATLGVEFFISPRTGIRLETSAMYLGMPSKTFDTGGVPTNFPIVIYQSNPIAVRYASGLFVLF